MAIVTPASAVLIWFAMFENDISVRLPVALLAAVIVGFLSSAYLMHDEETEED